MKQPPTMFSSHLLRPMASQAAAPALCTR